ncbi:hypothetical protein SDC9_74804 [bioreactor metagenome]|uniref:Uncharacterized protein n=1 Tax=bioreactor metagenome TaxID=1076179 RepID=A0A644YQ92_9ZZZZ
MIVRRFAAKVKGLPTGEMVVLLVLQVTDAEQGVIKAPAVVLLESFGIRLIQDRLGPFEVVHINIGPACVRENQSCRAVILRLQRVLVNNLG